MWAIVMQGMQEASVTTLANHLATSSKGLHGHSTGSCDPLSHQACPLLTVCGLMLMGVR